MSYTVIIKYVAPEKPADQNVSCICPIFDTGCGYADSEVFKYGHGDDYGKSVYATNVEGWGSVDQKEPYASTSIPFSTPLAQFKFATQAEDGKVEFDVDDYKEAFYYKELGEQMADQGFTVEVKKN